jgi:hypothetical protein
VGKASAQAYGSLAITIKTGLLADAPKALNNWLVKSSTKLEITTCPCADSSSARHDPQVLQVVGKASAQAYGSLAITIKTAEALQKAYELKIRFLSRIS